MKVIGFILITLGITLLLFVMINYVKEKNKLVSPVPEERGVKVIFVTPTK